MQVMGIVVMKLMHVTVTHVLMRHVERRDLELFSVLVTLAIGRKELIVLRSTHARPTHPHVTPMQTALTQGLENINVFVKRDTVKQVIRNVKLLTYVFLLLHVTLLQHVRTRDLEHLHVLVLKVILVMVLFVKK